jgi:hypothetical protein
MKKLIILFFLVLFFIEKGNTQQKPYRYLHKHEVFLSYRFNKIDYKDRFGIGYEFSLAKKKIYFSLANEFSSDFFILSQNVSDELMTTVKCNYQKKYIASFGIGTIYNFNINKVNYVAIADYKYDLYKYKTTISARVLLEVYKNSPSLGGVNPICVQPCPDFFSFWSYGITLGKYF